MEIYNPKPTIGINRLFKGMYYFCDKFIKKLYATGTETFFFTIAQ